MKKTVLCCVGLIILVMTACESSSVRPVTDRSDYLSLKPGRGFVYFTYEYKARPGFNQGMWRMFTKPLNPTFLRYNQPVKIQCIEMKAGIHENGSIDMATAMHLQTLGTIDLEGTFEVYTNEVLYLGHYIFDNWNRGKPDYNGWFVRTIDNSEIDYTLLTNSYRVLAGKERHTVFEEVKKGDR